MTEDVKEEIIKKTLMLIDKDPDEWTTFNDNINSFLIINNEIKSNIVLRKSELGFFECILQTSSLLITSERVISYINNTYYEIYYNDLKRFTNKFQKQNYLKDINGKYPKTNLIFLEGKSGKELLYEIDSDYPAYFSKLLITNLANYTLEGKLFWNPRQYNVT